MRIIRNDGQLEYAIECIKEEIIDCIVNEENKISLDSFYIDFKNIIKCVQGNDALSEMDIEITKRITKRQEQKIKALRHRINRLENVLEKTKVGGNG